MRRTIAIGLACFCLSPTAYAKPGDLLLTIRSPVPDGTANGFGFAMATLGNDILVGAPREHTEDMRFVGTVYLFDGETGRLKQTIANPEPDDFAEFGFSLLVSGDQFFVGAPDAANGDGIFVDFGKVFSFDVSSEHQYTILNPASGLSFGRDLDLVDEDHIAVTAPGEHLAFRNNGAAYIFNSHTGEVVHRFEHPTGRTFAASKGMATVDGLLAVGSRGDNPNNLPILAGSLYVFDSDIGAFRYRIDNPRETTEDPFSLSDQFGTTIATTNDKIVVGARLREVDGIKDAGAAYVFDADDGELLFTLDNPSPTPVAEFGKSITPIGDDILISAWRDNRDGGEFSSIGTAYLFDGDTGDALLEIPNPDPDFLTHFGFEVADRNGDILVSAPGVVYLFEGVPEPSSGVMLAIGLLMCVLRRRVRWLR